MSQQTETPLDDMLNRSVDEPELSPDNPKTRHQDEIFNEDGPEAFSESGKGEGEPKAEDARTDEPEKAQPAKAEEPKADTPDADPAASADDTSKQPKETLKPWQHAKINAAHERAQKAEERVREAEELVRSQAEWIRRAQAGQQPPNGQQGQQGQQPSPQQLAANSQTLLDQRDWELKNDLGWEISTQKHGEEVAHQATGWAVDRMKADPEFARKIRSVPNPVEFSIQELKKAQLDQQLAEHGYDLDALVNARMADMQPAPAAQTPGETPPSQPQEPRQSSLPQNMPGDFASAPSGAGRVASATHGMTPLSVLLDPKNKG